MGLIVLGWLPYRPKESRYVRPILQGLFAVATIGAALAFIEAVWLFPRQQSWQQVFGFSLIRALYGWIAVALLSWVLTLLLRTALTPPSYQRQQLKLQSFFVALGILPALLLTILPQMVWDADILPSSIGFSLLILVPVGYFATMFRRKALWFDRWIGKGILFVLLCLLLFSLYTAILELLPTQEIHYALQASIMTGTVLLVFFLKTPLEYLVESVITGRLLFDQPDVLRLSQALSRHPETTTLHAIIEEVAQRLQLEKSLLCLEEEMRETLFVAHTGLTTGLSVMQRYERFNKPLLPHSAHELFAVYPWAAVILPVLFSGKQIGFYAFSAPNEDTQLGSQQIAVLEELTQAVAFGAQAIFLLESADILAARTKQARALERQDISRQIHNHQLQALIGAQQLVHLIAPDHPLTEKVTDSMQSVTNDLRSLCHNLRDETLEMALPILLNQVITTFSKRESAPTVTLHSENIADFIPELPLAVAIHEIVTEALNNVYRHANAQMVRIAVVRDELNITLAISDDGEGTKQPISKSELIRSGTQFGVRDMYSQARSVHGQLQFEKNEHGGLTVHCVIPYKGIVVA